MSLPISPLSPWLAPLAGFSDLPFRLVCRECGCAVACTEMVSASGLIYQNPETAKILQTSPEDTPLVVQIFGSDPPTISQAVAKLKKQGVKYVDLNCGCSVKKVLKTGAGAALLTDSTKIVTIIQTIQEHYLASQIGIKTRLGFELNQDVYLKLAEKLSKIGIGWITLHPRYAKQKFAGQAKHEALKNLKQHFPQLKVIGSGDLLTAQDGVRCIKSTGIDGIMFARGALANPYVFTDYKALLKTGRLPQANLGQRLISLLKRFAFYYQKYPHYSVLKMRTLLPKMIKNIPQAKKIRIKLTQINSWQEVQAVIDQLQNHLQQEVSHGQAHNCST